ncbi:Alkylhydroperoxidase family enzyme, contains CxxC motif [Parasphingorhabdus marina DSM 22363]|uniref:Alkylhydroperoxidase family enzyme, contains CxxC motif n=1 Tax=Parasphingorhabdus marina DSM 22363 TaxID=1123272 RepID=A0A1N6D4E2_9SPHN|nr:carboxymuconolactone decarboxylase family protein [Parasphingorhabdus marina]SIN65603.1 Alkylhydroperoxidase family enzyme, contains CxxC motif [Parasphingorhabdus marina DSM 22363]
MKYDQPGLQPIPKEQLPDDLSEMLGDWVFNLHKTLAYSPDTLKAWMPFAIHILQSNRLPVRDREIAILRVGWNCRSAYEWGMHERVARSVGFSDDDLEAICVGPISENWTERESAILAAADDIHAQSTITDRVWKQLKPCLDPAELIDLVYLIGQFHMISVTLNAMRTPLEEGVSSLPEDKPHFTHAGHAITTRK